jgi:GNAT superfamily N-acetyltransferase
MQIAIRQFRPDDAQRCSELIRHCIEADESISQRMRNILLEADSADALDRRARSCYIVVGESEFGIVGVGALELNEISLLYVAPEYQHRGVGAYLLAHLESLVPAALFTNVFVYCSLNAARFYAEQGYRDGGAHSFEIGGEGLPTVFMTKAIRQP